MVRMLRAADLFCGAGGSTAGAEASGAVQVVYAVNHWMTAIQTHRQNHPNVHHVCARIDQIDPWREVPDIDLLMASPECTHHSNARGGRPVDDQKRATGWDVVRWAEARRPKWVIVENVREWLDWGPIGKDDKPLKSKKGETFKAWVIALESLGYRVEWRLLNAADFGEATKRIRLFVIARLGRSKAPLPWPVPTHTREQWRPAWQVIDWARPCPSIFGRKQPLAEKTIRRIMIGLRKFCGPAAEPFIVKMRGTNNGSSIHDPAPTLTGGGTHLGVAQPFVIQSQGPGWNDPNYKGVHGVDEPLRTLLARNNHGVVVPFQFQSTGRGAGRSKSIDEPVPTLIANRNGHGVMMPFVVKYHGGTDPKRSLPSILNRASDWEGQEPRTHDVADPLPAVTSHGAGCLAVPFLADVNHQGEDGRVHSVDDPLRTVTAKRSEALAMPFLADIHHGNDSPRVQSVNAPLRTIVAKPGDSLVLPFLTSYFANGKPQSVDEPLSTLTTKGRHGLALVELMQELGIIDIGFRMLHEDELARAQGFPDGYSFHGNKAEVIRMIGNAVCPGVMRALCSSIAAA